MSKYEMPKCPNCGKVAVLCRGHEPKGLKEWAERNQEFVRKKIEDGWILVNDGTGTDGLWKKKE